MQETINLFPFGKILKDRFDLACKYNLLECVDGTDIWRLSQKCKDNYEEVSFHYYLEGKVDIVKKRNSEKGKQQQNKLLLAM